MPGSNPPGFRIYRLLLVVGAFLLIGVACLAYWLISPRPATPHLDELAPSPIDEDIDQAMMAVNPGYVGIDVCAECHKPRAGVVKATRHFLSCRASDGVAEQGFAAQPVHLRTHVPELHYEMTRNGGDHFITRVEAAPQGEQRDSYRIGLVYGSGAKHDEMYFSWQEDRLYSLPVGWLNSLNRWGSHDMNQNQAMEAPPSCLECHNTWIGHNPGKTNTYSRGNMLLGVTCERCHGPGQEHVKHHRAHPEDPVAHAIVYPGSLNRELLMDVCAQCHVNHKLLGPVFAFRPGEPLSKTSHIPKPSNPEADSTNQVYYLSESKCFQKSDMTCITCHNPHRLKSEPNACQKCHAGESCNDRPNQPAGVRGDCIGCHMPPRIRTHFHLYSTDNDRFVPLATRYDHRIGIYPEAKQSVIRNWLRTQTDAPSRAEADRLTTQLIQFWSKVGDERVGVGRLQGAMGAYREALKMGPDSAVRGKLDEVIARQSRLDELSQSLNRVSRPDDAVLLLKRMLELKPNSESAHRVLGNLYASTGRRAEAVKHLEEVVKCDPNDASGLIRLAGIAQDEGRPQDALALCDKAYEINPTDPGSRHLAGMILLRQKRWGEAEKEFRRALALNPTHPPTNRGLSEALRSQGQASEAVRFARRAAHWSSAPNAEILLTLADAYTAAGRTDDARRELGEALRVAEETNPALISSIQGRIRPAP